MTRTASAASTRRQGPTRPTGRCGSAAFGLTLEEHGKVLLAIDRQGVVAARIAMREHIERVWERRRLPNHRGDASL